ncbi:hypothetical protein SESBI_34989, partial [Sesbania bispinosa]
EEAIWGSTEEALKNSFLPSEVSLPPFHPLRFPLTRVHRSSHPLPLSSPNNDVRANLHRFTSSNPFRIAQDNCGWLLNPISLALASGISGRVVTCASLHVGENRPGKLRGNHRHLCCHSSPLRFLSLAPLRRCRLLWLCCVFSLSHQLLEVNQIRINARRSSG